VTPTIGAEPVLGSRQHSVQPLNRGLVALRLDVPVGIRGLANAGVSELSMNPPDVRAAFEQPGRESVPRRVIRPVGELGPAEQGLPDLLEEEGVADEVAARGREDYLTLLGRSLFD